MVVQSSPFIQIYTIDEEKEDNAENLYANMQKKYGNLAVKLSEKLSK